MASNPIVMRELKSLQEELTTARMARAGAEAQQPKLQPSASLEPVREHQDLQELNDQLRGLANEITEFFEEAEKNIAAQPTQSVIGALFVGVLLGRLLGPR